MKAIKLLIGLVVLGLFGLVGSMDYQDELAEERHYCQMVKEGSWPAFKDGVNCNDSSNYLIGSNMEKVKAQLFIHKGFDGKPMVSTNDMRPYGFALLGAHEVEVPIPKVDVVEAEIEALYEQAGAIEAEALDKVRDLREKASELKKLKGDKNE